MQSDLLLPSQHLVCRRVNFRVFGFHNLKQSHFTEDEKVQQVPTAKIVPRVDEFVRQAHEQVNSQKDGRSRNERAAANFFVPQFLEDKAKHASGTIRSHEGCPFGHGGKQTRESKQMEERNAVVTATTKMLLEAGVETDEAEANAMAQEGYVRR